MLFLPPFSASLRSFLYRSHFLLFSGKITAFSFPAALQEVYLLLFLFFLGKARNLAANMPYAFEESRQILAADVAAFRASCNKKAGVAAQQPVDPTEGENNNAGK